MSSTKTASWCSLELASARKATACEVWRACKTRLSFEVRRKLAEELAGGPSRAGKVGAAAALAQVLVSICTTKRPLFYLCPWIGRPVHQPPATMRNWPTTNDQPRSAIDHGHPPSAPAQPRSDGRLVGPRRPLFAVDVFLEPHGGRAGSLLIRRCASPDPSC